MLCLVLYSFLAIAQGGLIVTAFISNNYILKDTLHER